MHTESIVAEMAKLTVSQRKALRRMLAGVAPGRDAITVSVFETASLVFVRKANTKFSIRLTPRGRVLETNQWAA